MTYRVLENNMLAICPSSGFNCCDFDDFYEAQYYAYSWSYSHSMTEVKAEIELQPFILNKEKDCSMSEFKIMMKIIEI